MSNRHIKVTDIPECLWHVNEGLLALPKHLIDIYREQLEAKGLLDIAVGGAMDEGPVGGMSEEDTKKHFATRFSGSCARVQLAVLDPNDDLGNASDLFIEAFSGGNVGLLDIPCGAGAASVSILTCVAALREKEIVPRTPLHVWVLGGDKSEYARGYASDLYVQLKPRLEKQAVFIEHKVILWDVLCSESTTALLHDWMTWAHNCRNYFVVAANFSGFLHKESKFDEAKPQLEEVFRWAGQRRSSVMWFEPQTNVVKEGFFPRCLKWLAARLPRQFLGKSEPESLSCMSEAMCRHPLKEGSQFRVHLSMLRLEASKA